MHTISDNNFAFFTASRISTLSASGRSYGETSETSANGRILSQSSIPDKDAITYPDDIIRDSYGNIVTPYTSLLDDTASVRTSTSTPVSIGHLTDVNKDNGQQLQFAIPSYSDGITELQGPYKPSLTLLPPLSSGNYNYPSLDTHKTSTSSAPSADNSYQNEVGGSFSSSAQSVKPVPTGPTAVTTNGHIGANNNYSPAIPSLNLEVPSQFPSAIPNQPKIPTSSSSYSNFPNVPSPNKAPASQGSSDFSAIHVSPSDNNAPTSSFSFTNTKPLKDTQFVNQQPIKIQVDTGKYTGGFGGAPGILGEQKVPGYAVKPTVSKPSFTVQVNNDHPGFNSVHSQSPPSATPNHNYFQSSVTTAKPNNVHQSGAYGQSNTNHGSFQFGTSFSQHPTTSSPVNNNGKYTGGFGGPPGIYSPYDNVKAGKSVAADSKPTSNAGWFFRVICRMSKVRLIFLFFDCRSD